MTTSDPASRVPNPEHLVAVPMFLGSRPERARPVTGVTLSGESVVHRLDDPWTLLLFVSTACDGCLELWDELVRAHATLPTAVTLLVVVHGSGEDASALSDRARSAPVVMSEQAWEDYGVHSPPFFVLVDRAGVVRTEGVAWSIEQVATAVAKTLDRSS